MTANNFSRHFCSGVMCHRLYHVCLFSLLLVCVKSQFTNDRKRIGPLDEVRAEHSCLQKFEVTENSIIRTEDSKRLGAKFLNESDVGNSEDCFHLCCITKYCDVAVFEDKESGSCFLFNCGMWEEPKCKFTPHTSYVTAKLKISRHRLDLGLWSAQHEQERELAILRSLSRDPGPHNYGPTNKDVYEASQDHDHDGESTMATMPATTIQPSTIVTTILPKVHSTRITSRQPGGCSRFQFECHSGECIAVYNVCDGISQCKDSSDEEDPALECPQGTTSANLAVKTSRSRDHQRDPYPLPQEGPRGPNPPPGWYGPRSPIYNDEDERYYKNKVPHMEQGGGPQSQGPDYHREQDMGYPNERKGSGYYDYNGKPFYKNQAYNPGVPSDWRGDGSGGNEMPQYHRDYPDYGQGYSSRQYPRKHHPVTGWDDRPLHGGKDMPYYPPGPPPPPPGNAYNKDSLHQQSQHEYLINSNNHQQNQQDYMMSSHPHQQYHHELQQGPGQHEEPTNQLLKPQHLNPNHQFTGTLPAANQTTTNMAGHESTMNKSPSSLVHSPEKEGAKSMTSSSKPESAKAPVPQANASTAKPSTSVQYKVQTSGKVALAALTRLEVDLEELELENKEQDAQSSGAILALSLGVCITALLVILVGCRLKGVKRRLRRHRSGKSYAHDADYLVNGMYL